MNTTTAIVLGAAGVAALGNWYSCLVHSKLVEYWTKPTATALLVVAACTIDVRHSDARVWFVAALVFSLAGDIFLMLPSERFVEGLGSFLLGHVAYVVGFVVAGIAATRTLIGGVVVALIVAPLALKIVRGARIAKANLVPPVALYMAVIATMVTCAIGSGEGLAMIGAGLFAFSDSLIGWTRFVQPLRWAGVAIMVTYHLGQLGLLVSLAR